MNIPNEAVQAARAVAEERYGSRPDAAYLRTVLTAAAPYLRAEAWEEGVDSEFQRSVMKRQRAANPYRSAGAGE
jgi:hypothetical protein